MDLRHLAALLTLFALPLQGCESPGCLDGDADCVIPSPCAGLSFSCDTGSTEAWRIETGEAPLGGPFSLASTGDFVLANDQVIAVFDAPDHPHYLSPSGGGLIDLVPRGVDQDGLRHVYQVAGLLPDEAAHYDEARILDDGPVKALQFTGHLDDRPEVRIATRYEIRPCEPGIRARTEIVNLGAEPESWYLIDAWYQGGREALPFQPVAGRGFTHPSFGLSTLAGVVTEVPFVAFGAHETPTASYATVTCDRPTGASFVSTEVSGFGHAPDLVMPRDWRSFERFIGVHEGPDIAGAAAVALEVRDQLWGEPHAEITGRVVAPVGPSMVSTGLRASLVVSEGTEATPPEQRVPWSHVQNAADGSFSVTVPAGREYLLQVEAYGQQVGTAEVSVGDGPVDVGDIEVPGVGELTLEAAVDGDEHPVLAFVHPADDATAEAVRGRMFGQFTECAPLLGNPHGRSPACNRVIVDGPTTVTLPPGTYDVYATAGPFATLARQGGITVAAGEGQSLELDLERLDLQPEGTLTADFHVHGAASFDSQFTDHDRVRAFLASGTDVIVTTEHDTAWDYAQAMADLEAHDDLELVVGTESTGHILFDVVPDDPNPKVIGHWNFWPVPFDAEAPWRGAAWDEKVLPGELMTRMAEAGWDPVEGVCQLNHPISGLQLGRAFGWVDSLDIDGTRPLATEFDGTGQSVFLQRPEGSDFGNADYDVQEVMNGTNNGHYLEYRAFWFYLMQQGIFRAGTANSDSHTLTENVLGVPRTVVSSSTDRDDFDLGVFDAAVKEGRMFGTNGPVLEVATTDAQGGERTPSMALFTPATDAALSVRVAAAPWVPVEQVRFIVNGEVAHTIDDLPAPGDPFGDDEGDFERLDTTVPLADLVPAGQDAWLVVEVGTPHLPAADLDCDGFPDTTDNNGDGAIDWRDVEGLGEAPEGDCLSETGPLRPRPPPDDRTAPLYHFHAVTPEGYPLAFSNPLILDGDGDGAFTGQLR